MQWRGGGGDRGAQAPADGGARWGALSYPMYRRYWISMFCRVFGLQFRFIGLFWLVVSDDGLHLDPIWLGIVGISSSLPTIILSVPAGIVADRYEHKQILLLSQTLTAIASFILAGLIVSGAVELWMVIMWAIVTGALAALANPAQSAMLPRLIDMSAMASAVAMTSSVWNTMRIVGPAAAGVLIALIGTGQAFFVTALGFALSAVLVATLKLKPVPRRPAHEDGGLWEGMRYISRHPIFLATIGLSFFTSLFGASYQVLLPVFADDVLSVGSEGFGLMEAAAGVGSFLGTLAIIRVGGGPRAGLVMIGSAALFGLFIAAFSTSRYLPLSMLLLFAGGFAASMYLNIGMTTLQLLVPDELRGRVMGVWSMTWFLAAIGGLPASGLAQLFGAPFAVAFGALSVTGFAAVVYLTAPSLRQLARTNGPGGPQAEGAPAGG